MEVRRSATNLIDRRRPSSSDSSPRGLWWLVYLQSARTEARNKCRPVYFPKQRETIAALTISTCGYVPLLCLPVAEIDLWFLGSLCLDRPYSMEFALRQSDRALRIDRSHTRQRPEFCRWFHRKPNSIHHQRHIAFAELDSLHSPWRWMFHWR